MGKAVTCTVSSCMGQNHRPSNCTKNYLRPERAEVSQDAPVVLSTKKGLHSLRNSRHKRSMTILQSLTNTVRNKSISVQHTINFVGTVDHRVCSMCVPD